MKFILVVFIVSSCFFNLNAQNITSRINTMTGNSLNIFFNHLSDYNNGITLENYTRLHIYYNDTTDAGLPTGPGWRLSVKAQDPQIFSEGGTNSIPLDRIQVRSGATTLTLSNTFQVIASGTENNAYSADILISYDIGKINSITTVSNETFVVDINFLLETNY